MSLLEGLPYRHFKVVHADVPWRFQSYSEAGEERSAQNHYDCMSLRDIARLNVEAHTAEDCHLFFWVTGPFLAAGAHIQIMRSWGFEPTAMAFVWLKLNQGWHPRWPAFMEDAMFFMGLGHTTRQNAEYVILGKKGKLSEAMKELGRLPAGDRPAVGAAANKVKQAIEDRVAARLGELVDAAGALDLQRTVDVTLPARPVGGGHLHLLTQVRLEAIQIFAELGFVVADGPQIETDWHTFEALAIPKDHPARDMQDTFYVSEDIVLRTHTSPVQVRTMLTQPPPIRIVAPGHVYRRDDDPTHSPMFTQLEGLAVDEGISFADLKGVLLHFVKRFFAKDLGIRLRPSYFPFV